MLPYTTTFPDDKLFNSNNRYLFTHGRPVVAVSYLVLLKTVSSSPSCENISDRSDIDISSSERSSPGSDEVNFRRGYRVSTCSLSLGAGGFSRDLTQVYNSVPVRIVSTDIARCLYKSRVSE